MLTEASNIRSFVLIVVYRVFIQNIGRLNQTFQNSAYAPYYKQEKVKHIFGDCKVARNKWMRNSVV